MSTYPSSNGLRREVWTALYDYNAVEEDELSLKRGQTVEIFSKDPKISGNEGWWTGKIDNRFGIFPSNYVSRQNLQHLVEIDFSELTLKEIIGVGGFGKVHLGRWRNEDVAIKMSKFEHEGNLDAEAENVLREARLFWVLRHPNIVNLRGVCLQAPDLCLVMDYARGGPLNKVLSNYQINLAVVVDWAIQIGSGMEYLHNKAPISVLHRDLKSSNVLLSKPFCQSRPLDQVLKITDFGLAREYHSRTLYMSSAAGTYAWMAPEVIKLSAYSKASDIWSFGVVLWELLTGEVPYRGTHCLTIAYGVAVNKLTLPIPSSCPETFANIMKGCWQQNFHERPHFPDILHQLQSVDVAAHRDSLSSLQNSWRVEIEALFAELHSKEKELHSREKEISRAFMEQKQKEEALRRREAELHRRELEIVERELNILIQQDQNKPEPCQPRKSRSRLKLHRGGHTAAAGGTSPEISRPLDFRHRITVQSSPNLSNGPPINLRAFAVNHPRNSTWGPSSLAKIPRHRRSKSTPNLQNNNLLLPGWPGDLGPDGKEQCKHLSLPRHGMKPALYNMAHLLASLALGRDLHQALTWQDGCPL